MKTYADTGFVVTLYKEESTSETACDWMSRQTQAVGLSQFGELEFRNALRLAVFRHELTPKEASDLQRLFYRDVENGVFLITPIASAALFARAMELADRHSSRFGTRSLDLLHVAAALLSDADTFLSFDERQRKVAKAEGLKVKP
jgi:predicted nucleic acid-binding protein